MKKYKNKEELIDEILGNVIYGTEKNKKRIKKFLLKDKVYKSTCKSFVNNTKNMFIYDILNNHPFSKVILNLVRKYDENGMLRLGSEIDCEFIFLLHKTINNYEYE